MDNIIVVIGYLGMHEPKSGLYFGLALLLQEVLAYLLYDPILGFVGFLSNAKFVGGTGKSDFPEYMPLQFMIYAVKIAFKIIVLKCEKMIEAKKYSFKM